MTDEDFRETLEVFAESALQHRAKHAIIDVREFHHRPSKEILAWRDETTVAKYNEAGVERQAWVPTPDERGSIPREATAPSPTCAPGSPPAATRGRVLRVRRRRVREGPEPARLAPERPRLLRAAARSPDGLPRRRALRLDNNLPENALRKVVLIRDAALFAGSDEHTESAGHILSLVASARLHHLDPEAYLRNLIRVLPFWPRDRFLELALSTGCAPGPRSTRSSSPSPSASSTCPRPATDVGFICEGRLPARNGSTQP